MAQREVALLDPVEELIAAIQELSLARDLGTVMTIVRRTARALTGADGATFVLKEGTNCFYADEDAVGPLWKGNRFPLTSCISGWVMHHRTAAIVPDIYQDDRIPVAAYRPTFVKSLAMVPIRRSDPIAAIGNYWATNHAATETEIKLLQALADSTSVAMENIQVYAELEKRVRDRTAELEVANRELEAFSYTVSHDLRAPVRHIQGFITILRNVPDQIFAEKSLEVLERLARSADRMGSIIDDILKLTRLSMASVRRNRVNLSQMAREVFDSLVTDARSREAFVEEADIFTTCDPSLMRVVFENLLGNAIKFSAKVAQPRIRFGRVPDTEDEFFVADNGAGFEQEYVHKLFQPFQRLHTLSEFTGSGIGLATVRRVVEKHGGTVRAVGSPGGGATIYFRLPSNT